MSTLQFLLKVSRPRFWLYVFGPYLVGLAAGAAIRDDFVRIENLVFGLYFLLPANLLIYGINDIFDWETDRLNPKKAEYEMLVRPESHRSLSVWIALLNLPFVLAAYLLAPQSLTSLAGFIFFSVFYSAPPIRAKAIPIVDSLFNILYVFPAAFAYQMMTGSFPPWAVIFAAGLWTMAMHAFSAIPDIDADREARVSTVATVLGKNGTLVFCLIAYLGSAALAFQYLGIWVIIPAAVYATLIGFSWSSKNEEGIFQIYQRFPIVNAVIGFVLFWVIAWPKLL
jgi:lycopene elongase/hydratase (dihydrobisanhydrobacterioruberin-forming)